MFLSKALLVQGKWRVLLSGALNESGNLLAPLGVVDDGPLLMN